jgi:hypothetical protein
VKSKLERTVKETLWLATLTLFWEETEGNHEELEPVLAWLRFFMGFLCRQILD